MAAASDGASTPIKEVYHEGILGGVDFIAARFDPSDLWIMPSKNPEPGYEPGQMKDVDYSFWKTKVFYEGFFESLHVEEGVLNIPNDAFWHMTGAGSYSICGLGFIELPSSLKTIGDNAFSECRIKEIIIPETMRTVTTWDSSERWYPVQRPR
ncbi:MAG: leucine-rich repeat protein [Candidatus Methanomethylophilaceae archaeon]|nr:leucine-rich repeat protein [Candidatus Methanomethylophilaceae archaeon]